MIGLPINQSGRQSVSQQASKLVSQQSIKQPSRQSSTSQFLIITPASLTIIYSLNSQQVLIQLQAGPSKQNNEKRVKRDQTRPRGRGRGRGELITSQSIFSQGPFAVSASGTIIVFILIYSLWYNYLINLL